MPASIPMFLLSSCAITAAQSASTKFTEA